MAVNSTTTTFDLQELRIPLRLALEMLRPDHAERLVEDLECELQDVRLRNPASPRGDALEFLLHTVLDAICTRELWAGMDAEVAAMLRR